MTARITPKTIPVNMFSRRITPPPAGAATCALTWVSAITPPRWCPARSRYVPAVRSQPDREGGRADYVHFGLHVGVVETAQLGATDGDFVEPVRRHRDVRDLAGVRVDLHCHLDDPERV